MSFVCEQVGTQDALNELAAAVPGPEIPLSDLIPAPDLVGTGTEPPGPAERPGWR